MSEFPPKDPKEEAIIEKIFGPVVAEFKITQTPQGGAPSEIKNQWIGVTLPVRENNVVRLENGYAEYYDYISDEVKQNDAPVCILAREAIRALIKAGKDEAADFWKQYQIDTLVFRSYEGELKFLDEPEEQTTFED